jgi:hypothetical protein
MLGRQRTLICLAFAGALFGCASPPPPPPPPKPVVIGPPTDTLRIPLTDLLTRTYYGSPGGLYPGGINQPPADHDSAARLRRNAMKALDVNGDESPFGKYVLLSIGTSNATQEWCSKGSGPPCAPWSFMGKAAADPGINHYTLVIVNGAAEDLDAPAWTSAASPTYDRIKVARLAPLGLSENQVQAVWVELQDPKPSASLASQSAASAALAKRADSVRRASLQPAVKAGTDRKPAVKADTTQKPPAALAASADSLHVISPDSVDTNILLTNLGMILRALRTRYPNLRLVFVSSRIYGGYATLDLNAEPYAYESGFSVKSLIESQVNEMRGLPANPRAGTLDYTKKAAPLILWGPYMWADGATPRSDGFAWQRADFEEDGTHPSQAGETKVADKLLDFFKNSPYTRCWFVTSGYCL